MTAELTYEDIRKAMSALSVNSSHRQKAFLEPFFFVRRMTSEYFGSALDLFMIIVAK